MGTTTDLNLFSPPSVIEKQVNRLFRITGFVTLLHEPDDSRNLVFARYYHVRRVVWVSTAIAIEYEKRGINIDFEKLNLLAWAHDLNRWPFSHNSEKGYYNQGADLKRYIEDNNLSGLPLDIMDVRGIIEKKTNGISREADIVLLSDIITGFIEDPLWLTTALNLAPRIIPDNVAECLCIAKYDKLFLDKLYEANLHFYASTSHEEFAEKFDLLFSEVLMQFLKKEDFFFGIKLNSDYFSSYRRLIKDRFLVKVVYPYNNEKISRGFLIKDRILKPFLTKIDNSRVNKILTEIDEEQFMRLVVELDIITPEDIPTFYPLIDYIEEFEPELSFRNHYESRRSY